VLYEFKSAPTSAGGRGDRGVSEGARRQTAGGRGQRGGLTAGRAALRPSFRLAECVRAGTPRPSPVRLPFDGPEKGSRLTWGSVWRS